MDTLDLYGFDSPTQKCYICICKFHYFTFASFRQGHLPMVVLLMRYRANPYLKDIEGILYIK